MCVCIYNWQGSLHNENELLLSSLSFLFFFKFCLRPHFNTLKQIYDIYNHWQNIQTHPTWLTSCRFLIAPSCAYARLINGNFCGTCSIHALIQEPETFTVNSDCKTHPPIQSLNWNCSVCVRRGGDNLTNYKCNSTCLQVIYFRIYTTFIVRQKKTDKSTVLKSPQVNWFTLNLQ